uniref:SprT-like domain-containing protein n=1 Tax=Parastrongyloides trichosuri TaxID=131310 RepID=A0A0N4ZN47_PARTI
MVLMNLCYKIFNKYCFGNLLPEHVVIEWDNHLTKVSGTTNLLSNSIIVITLSQKICNTPYRIRDTILHEMCHIASYIIDGINDYEHGECFGKWTEICRRGFPKIPQVSKNHSHKKTSKSKDACEECSQEIVDMAFLKICDTCNSNVPCKYRYEDTYYKII